MNLFYSTGIDGDTFTLNSEESKHIVRVLRMKVGDRVRFTDGNGFFYDCSITDANPKACRFNVARKSGGTDKRSYIVQIAIAPTKNISRFEWFLEKATEIGIDKITPLVCVHSERKDINAKRLERVLVAAMKQSLKSQLPVLFPPVKFKELIRSPFSGQKFIAYIDKDITLELSKGYQPGQDALILIGPEGDFSHDEVELAKEQGFIPIKLGPSRLRTETAGVVACHTIHLMNYRM